MHDYQSPGPTARAEGPSFTFLVRLMLHQWDETSLVVRLSGSTGLIERSIYIEVSKREQVCCNYINIELAYETSASAPLSTVSPAAPSPVLPAKSPILPTLNSSVQSEAIFFEMGHCELFVQPFAYLSLLPVS